MARKTRAQQLREDFAAHMRDPHTTQPMNIAVEFIKSRTWGYCPRVYFGGHTEAMATASGCGYDKESAALADALCGLVPVVGHCHGAGVESVIRIMDEHGWTLAKVGWGPSFSCYSLSRKAVL